MTITTPQALLLLLLIPLVVYLGWPRNRFRRVRDISSLILRIIIVTLLVLALAGVQIAQSADRLAVVFLVDVSDSMGGDAEERALEYMRLAIEEMQPDDVAGIVTFGADAQVARSMSSAREITELRTIPDSGNTNLAGAIRLGLALFPGDTARRMVVISDGQPTLGDARAAAGLAEVAGVEISFVPYHRPEAPEVQLRNVSVPTVLDENQSFDMTLTIASDQDTRAVVNIRAGGEIIQFPDGEPWIVDLREGVNTFSRGLISGTIPLLDFDVQVEPLGDDGFYQNNTLSAFSRVEGVSRILVINGSPDTEDETRHIVPALEDSGFEVVVGEPADIPFSLAALAQYDTVMLLNVSATKLNNARMDALKSYVADLGGGLVVVGGPQAYAPGGYFKTPLEEVLPVEMQIRDQQRLPQLTIAYVIDRSGSMGMISSDGIPNIDLAKEAIIRSIDFLQPTDRAAVASFDVAAYWIARFQDVDDRERLQRFVATLRASGGTSIMAGMQLAAQDIVSEPSQIKHIILLTDGGAEPGGLVELSRRLYEEQGVTTSVISIGDFNAGFLERMAEVSGGNFHQVPDAASVPEIFSQETVLISRTYIQEEEFVPRFTSDHPIMQNISALPSLQGYVATSSRDTAQTILRGPEPHSDPILAAWQFGLGRSVAFTSDATARWGQNWVNWDEYTRFWNQVIRWTITEGASNNLETHVEMEDEQARIVVDARDNEGAFLNGLDLQASVVSDIDEGSIRVSLRQTAPGRYEATFNPQDEGAYFMFVTNRGTDNDPAFNLSQTSGWVMSYSPEYEIREFDDGLLEAIADLTNGQDLSATPEAVFAHNLDARSASVPMWPWLLLVAMLLLPLDIAVRRLLVTRTDLRRLRAWTAAKIRPAQREEVAERMSTLREARDRARTRTEAGRVEGQTSSIGQLRQRREEQSEARKEPQPVIQSTESSPPPRPRREPPPEPVRKPGEAEEPSNIGARLLKRRRRDEDED